MLTLIAVLLVLGGSIASFASDTMFGVIVSTMYILIGVILWGVGEVVHAVRASSPGNK